ncbi:CPBP family intramembrane glutamic endopeptidase [Phytomonospora endophytica]|uniref:Membrane protease YdiL (CAAX protease family) n=1 Tax=Phytomonospora endophytica TaxID=714109 RepID=A0A841FW97_9ACTN|nr:CPBP family intramembrane glutamic endopeptidase [Phytomonospora endophytica]MBB6037812.1 membrane protease YdiL (CAAX protease family) [Phytomonospora endophytica]
METTRKSGPLGRLADKLLADRHSLPLTIALHLIPGALIVAAYFLIAEPFVKAIEYPIFLAWSIALCIVLFPLLAGLYLMGRRRNGRFSLRGVLHYTDKPLPRGKVVKLGIAVFLWMLVLSSLATPLDSFMFDHFFTWVPYTNAGGSATTYINGYSHSVVLTTMVISLPLTGISLPLIEELYFRGFLLPRMAHLRGAAPVLNTVLFSVYHFWSPWGIVSRVIFFLPGPWLVWRKKDIRLSIAMHVGVTTVLATLGVAAVALNLI